MKVLFVCAGNLCRSPFAEGLARRLATERGLDIEFESAGEIAYEGSPCTPAGVAAARLHGVLTARIAGRQGFRKPFLPLASPPLATA